jgi:hypothetical protein
MITNKDLSNFRKSIREATRLSRSIQLVALMAIDNNGIIAENMEKYTDERYNDTCKV